MQQQYKQSTSYFDFAEHCIKVEVSFLSGKERVFLNDELLSERRNWKYHSVHHFTIDDKNAEIRITTASILKGPIQIALYLAGEYIDSDQWDYQRIEQQLKAGQKAQPWWRLLLGIFTLGLMGAIVGYAFGTWVKG